MIEKGEIGHNMLYIHFFLPIYNMCFEPSFQNLDVLQLKAYDKVKFLKHMIDHSFIIYKKSFL